MSYQKQMRGLVPHEYPKRTRDIKLPKGVVRLFGENWAFAVEVEGALEELAEDHWQFEVTRIWGGEPKRVRRPWPKNPPKYEWRLSPFRQNLFTPNIYRTQPSKDDYPVIGFEPVGDNTTTLLVERVAAASDRNQDLLHLTQGRIEVPAVREECLSQLYSKLGLSAPKTPQSIFLYPDGFCICAMIVAPLGGRKIEGWFKLTSRSLKLAGDAEAAVYAGLELCFDPVLPNSSSHLNEWRAAVRRIDEAFDGIGRSKARWLSHSLVGAFSPEHLFWPVDTVDELAVERSAEGRMLLSVPFLKLLLRPGRASEQQIGGMQIGGDVLLVEKKSNGEVHITTPVGPGGDSAMLRYDYSSEPTSEELHLGSNGHLDLAVPLIETARMLREQSGLPERPPKYGTDPVGPLWTFTPIETGWLHWPFPDATLEGLDSLEPPPAARPPEQQQGAITGSILLGNHQGLPEFEPRERPWQLSLGDGREGRFELILKQLQPSGEWELQTAKVQVASCIATLEGAVPVVPFAQTSERLLPDHDERALRSRSLRAVSPELLRGLERDMWLHAEASEESKQLVQAKLSVLGFSLTAPETDKAPTRLDGKVQLRVRIASRKKCDTSKEEALSTPVDPSLSPWVWSRHDTLACVQTLPLAVAGTARIRPSGLHELAPLMRCEPDASLLYSFEDALDMRAIAPRLIIDSQHAEGERYVAPWHKHNAINEIGMAVLTLPSVTLFPGITKPSDEARLTAREGEFWRWPVGSRGNTPFQMELRHDIALRDAFFAKARAPQEETRGEAKVVAGTGFSPLPSNGPQLDGANSWEAVWRDNQHRAGLAASFSRAMVITTDAGRSLTGLIRLREHPLKSFAFSSEVIFDEKELHRIGQVSLSLSGDRELPPLAGLPDGGDLEGFSGELDGHSLAHGTLTAQGDGTGFVDQFELATGPLESTSGMLRHKAGDLELYSLAKPQLATSIDGREISFWFVDVPSEANEATKIEPQHWADMVNQHREGMRWSVSDPSSPWDGCIALPGQLYFERLELGDLSPPNSASGGRLELYGRLGLSYAPDGENSEFLPQLLAPDRTGLSKLVLVADEAGEWAWSIEFAPECHLQLERAGANGAPPALLKLADGKTTSLVIDLFGTKAEIPIGNRNVDSGRPCFGIIASDEPLPDEDNFRVAVASVWLGGARPSILLEWQYAFTRSITAKQSDLVAQVSGRVRHPHYHGHVPETANLGEVQISLQSGDTSAKLAAPVLTQPTERLGDGLFSINFGGSVSAAFKDSWLDRFSPSDAAGGLLALVEAQPDGKLTAPDFRFMSEVTLAASTSTSDRMVKALRLQLRMTRGESAIVRLEGEKVLKFGANDADLQCESYLRFDGNALTSVGAHATLGAHVIHSVRYKGGAPLRIATVQHVKLEKSAADLSMVVVLDREREPAQLVFMQLRDANANQVVITAHELPPLAPIVRGGAKRALGEILSSPVTENNYVWSDRLLASDVDVLFLPSLNQHQPDGLFAWAAKGATPAAYQLASPKPLRMYEPAAYKISAKLAELFRARKDLPYTWYLDKMTEQLERLLLAAPGEFLSLANRRGYALFGPDVHKDRLSNLGVQTGVVAISNSEVDSEHLASWDRNLLAALAPWSVGGLIEAYDSEGGVKYRVIRSRSRMQTVSRLPGDPWRSAGQAWSDPRKVPMPQTGLELHAAYHPTAVRAVDLEYIKEEDGSVIAEGFALAARALERSWQLAGPQQEGLYSMDADYWLGSRQSVAFRKAAPLKKLPEIPYRLTPEYRPEAELVAAPGMVLSTLIPVATGEVTLGEQAYAPAQVLLRDISARSGVWHSRRLGLATIARVTESSQEPPKQKPQPGLAGSEVPVHARVPRPPRTAINDRLRANDFDTAHFSLAAQPEFILYGPRSKSPIAPGEPQAVTREPLCQSASLGRVEIPDRGLLDSNWKGVIRLKLEPLQGNLNWKPKEEARATLDGKTYKLKLTTDDQNSSDGSLTFLLADKSVDLDNPRDSFASAARSVALSTRALIECEFKLELAGEVPLRRTAAFELPVNPGHAPTEKLLFIRFEDPAYNDRLILPAKVAKDAKGTLLCADREAVSPQDMVTIAWRDLDASSLPDELSVTVSRADGKAEPKNYELEDLRFWASLDKQAVANLDCTRLQWKDDDEKLQSLQVGDKLELAPKASNRKWDSALRLTFDVTQDPLFPANPAGLAFLRLDRSGDKPQLSAPLFAQSPTPTLIELIDPRDLFSGIARFRAIYQWLLFIPLECASSRTQPKTKTMMQKIDGNGGSYLPAELDQWIDFPAEFYSFSNQV